VGQKAALYIFGGALALILLCGGLTVLGAMAGGPKQAQPAAGDPRAEAQTSQARTAEPSKLPTIEKRRVTETQEIPFETKTVNDRTLATGTQQVRTQGVAGVRTLTYEVTFTNGAQTDKKLIVETVTQAPITMVIAVGIKQVSQCDPNYSGACVPIASDVDCAGGSGNGPAYVRGPVKVIGTDIYDLDRDGDGWGCE
jgi:hypothetical protein